MLCQTMLHTVGAYAAWLRQDLNLLATSLGFVLAMLPVRGDSQVSRQHDVGRLVCGEVMFGEGWSLTATS